MHVPSVDMDTLPAARRVGRPWLPLQVAAFLALLLSAFEFVEVQMALAELDRANGLDCDEEPEINPDLFCRAGTSEAAHENESRPLCLVVTV